MKLAYIYADTVGNGRCRDHRCNARITWAELVGSGKKMPFDDLVALRTDREQATGRQIWEVDLEANHWAKCPGSNNFRKRAPVA